VLLFLANLWQIFLSLSGIQSSLLTVAFVAPASCLLLIGIYLEYNFWSSKLRQILDQGEMMSEIIEKIIRLRRPDMAGDEQVKESVKKYLRRHLSRLSLAVIIGIIDEWERPKKTSP